jgi:ribosomal-protein-alanine N-acetyltransferase
MPGIRRGKTSDLPEIAAIQAASPESAQWDVKGYLQYDLLVAISDNRVAGFLVARPLDTTESEILNLAVAPEFRRRGLAKQLVKSLLNHLRGTVFLEVRESNRAAQNLYKSMGFQAVSRRPQYYDSPPEAAIVMKFHSC